MLYKEKMAPQDGDCFVFHLGLGYYNLPKVCQKNARHLKADKVHKVGVVSLSNKISSSWMLLNLNIKFFKL